MNKIDELVQREMEYSKQIRDLEEKIIELEEEVEKFRKWWNEANNDKLEYLKYKHGFEVLVKTLKG